MLYSVSILRFLRPKYQKQLAQDPNFLVAIGSIFVVNKYCPVILFSNKLGIRGASKSGKEKILKTSKKRPTYDDEDEDEDKYNSKRSEISKNSYGSSKARGKGSKNTKLEIVPWNDRSYDRGPSWKERLEEIAKRGQSMYKDVYRQAKVKFFLHALPVHDTC